MCYFEGKGPSLLPASELKPLPQAPHLPSLPPADFECLWDSKGFSPRFLQHRGGNPQCQGSLLPTAHPPCSALLARAEPKLVPPGGSWQRKGAAGRSLQGRDGHVSLSPAQQDERVALGTTASSAFTFSPTTPPLGRRNKSDCENQPIWL